MGVSGGFVGMGVRIPQCALCLTEMSQSTADTLCRARGWCAHHRVFGAVWSCTAHSLGGLQGQPRWPKLSDGPLESSGVCGWDKAEGPQSWRRAEFTLCDYGVRFISSAKL